MPGRERLIDLTEAEFDRAPARRRGSSRRKPASRPVARDVVSDRILDCLAEGAAQLRALQDLAAAMGPAADLRDPLRTLLAASETDLGAAIAASLAQPGTRFLDLWDAATFREHRSILKPAEHGPAAVAYHAILKGAGPGDLGRYAGELAAPGLAELMRLVKAQRRLLAAIGALLGASPAVFDRPLFLRPRDSTCYWALTLATSALRHDVPAAAAIPLQAPMRPFPVSFDGGLAVFEDAFAVSSRTLDILPRWEKGWGELRCPPAWNIGYDAAVAGELAKGGR